MHKSNFNGSILKEYLEFLINRGLVEERTVKKNQTVFVATQRGITMLKYFHELSQEISAMEEA
jgi:predicted transcriptional regulator